MARADHECDDGTQPWSPGRVRRGAGRSTGDDPFGAADFLPDRYGTAEVPHEGEACECCNTSAGRISDLLWHIYRLRLERDAERATVDKLRAER